MRNGCQLLLRTAAAAAFSFAAAAAGADVGSDRPLAAYPDPVPDCGSYRVRPGDTLSGIASRAAVAEVTPSAIFALNRDVLSSPDLLRVGQVLRIPCGAAALSVPPLAEPEGPELVSAPLWEARAGEPLVEVLIRWGREAGFDVIVERGSDWRFGVPFRHSGSFRGAVDEVISGFSTAAVPPYVTFYTNNVMTIGAR